METSESSYWAKQVSETLGIADSTLRKWARQLEAAGYRFAKDEKERRAFTEHDVIMLRNLKELTQDKNVGFDTAIGAVVARFKRDAVSDVPLPATQEEPQDDERYIAILEEAKSLKQEIADHQAQQTALNQVLLQRLDEQQQYIEKVLKERDEHLMTAVRELQEQRRLIAASQEEPKGFWRRLFGGKK